MCFSLVLVGLLPRCAEVLVMSMSHELTTQDTSVLSNFSRRINRGATLRNPVAAHGGQSRNLDESHNSKNET